MIINYGDVVDEAVYVTIYIKYAIGPGEPSLAYLSDQSDRQPYTDNGHLRCDW